MKKRLRCIFVLCLSVLALVVLFNYNGMVVRAESTQYSVTFDFDKNRVLKYITDEGGKISSSLKSTRMVVGYGAHAVEPAQPSSAVLQSYTYSWTVNGVEVDVDNYAITQDTTFVAKWTPRSYKVYFRFGGVESEVVNKIDSIAFTIESPRIVLYTPIRPNYAFRGWYETPNDSGTMQMLYISPKSVGDKILYAKFSPIEYYIEYNTSATHNNPRGYNVEDGDISLESPSLYGHIFKGWYLDKQFKTPISTIDCSEGGNINLYAKWELETYNVTYVLPSGDTSVVEVEYGTTAQLPKMQKSIFEVVKTDKSRDNITEDTTIKIEIVNIWYVYVIVLVALGGGITLAILLKKKRENAHNNLRNIYYSNLSRRK